MNANKITEKDDLAQATDCVNHEILLPRLHFCGIQGVSAKLCGCYLTSTKQKVQIQSSNETHNSFSILGAIKHGIPQGPLSFIIHINDLLLYIITKDICW